MLHAGGLDSPMVKMTSCTIGVVALSLLILAQLTRPATLVSGATPRVSPPISQARGTEDATAKQAKPVTSQEAQAKICFERGEALSKEYRAEPFRTAVAEYHEAANLWHAAGNFAEEARCLRGLAETLQLHGELAVFPLANARARL